MLAAVTDASAFVLAARGSDNARNWLAAIAAGRIRAQAPDFIQLEIGNALCGYVRAGLMRADEADLELRRALSSVVELVPTSFLSREALALAIARNISVYDAAYLALALGTDSILVTADRRLAAEAERSALLPEQGPL